MPRAPALPSFPPNDTLTGSPLQTAPYFYYSRRNGTGDGARCTQALIAQFRRRSILIGGTQSTKCLRSLVPRCCDPHAQTLQCYHSHPSILPQHQYPLSVSTATLVQNSCSPMRFPDLNYGAWRHILSRSVEVAFSVLFSFNGNNSPPSKTSTVFRDTPRNTANFVHRTEGSLRS
jgi:hypothetical protein